MYNRSEFGVYYVIVSIYGALFVTKVTTCNIYECEVYS
jgi:hypothetical protein